MTVNEQVPDGWQFMTADFGSDEKYVQLVRTDEQCGIWMRRWGHDGDLGLAPTLYVRGYGEAFEEALAAACDRANELGVLTDVE